MSVIRSDLRPGVYCDSIVLMQLQSALADLPGVEDAGAVMGTEENLDLLRANDLFPEELSGVPRPSDLVLAVRADSEESARGALSRVDELLTRRRAVETGEFRPRTLASAARDRPDARWVLVSVPGRHAARLAREALRLDRHVFLFSDNVPIAEEVELKRSARERGLLVMGPDCGTAVINGVGFGFANRVRRGAVGLVAASGTGLQAISTYIHRSGAGVSHAIGTGGRDLSSEVGAITALQGLDLLSRDPDTRVIVLVSKPPSPDVAGRVLEAAGEAGKPAVIHFLGDSPSVPAGGPLFVSANLREAADLALKLLGPVGRRGAVPPSGGETRSVGGDLAASEAPAAGGGYLRALFAGGTLATECVLALRGLLTPLHSNIRVGQVDPVPDSGHGRGHTVLDLGADEFTVGRPHPMIDHDLRIQRLAEEAADPEVRAVLLDVVLGDGAHPDPASALAPAIEAARKGRDLQVVVVLIGTDEDPQDLEAQASILTRAGARVRFDLEGALEAVCERLGFRSVGSREAAGRARTGITAAPEAGTLEAGVLEAAPPVTKHPVELGDLLTPIGAINVGLESFYESLVAQGAEALHVDWRPPAGGDERLLAILDQMRT